MSAGAGDVYTEAHRAFQDRFDTRRLADRVEEALVADRLSEADMAFIAARDMFFLATVDSRGRPACSYKGGAPGFVRALDDRTLAFPFYDGNGMFVTAGNMLETRWVSLLFIAFDEPERLRVSGTASFDPDDVASDVLPQRDVDEIARRRRQGLALPDPAGASSSDQSSLVPGSESESR